jgi:hypothetical protein
MRKLLMAMVAAAVLAVPAASRAGFDLGLRLGYGGAAGDVGTPTSTAPLQEMKNYVKSEVPFQVDLGWRVNRHLTLGGYLSWAVAQETGDFKTTYCDVSGISCGSYVFRVGAQALWNFIPMGTVDPWIGIGTGWELLNLRAEDATDHIQFQFSGWEIVNLQAGLDFHLGRVFSLGPFFMWSLGQYGSYEVSSSIAGLGESGSMFDKGMHSWYQFGVRGNFDWGGH